jgi:putative ABC transport system permease protein
MAFVAVMTLGIGLSASVALLGVIDGGTRDLPVPGGRDIVELEVRDGHARRVTPAAPSQWAIGSGVVEAGALVQMEATLTHPAAPALRLTGAAMQPQVFALLRMQPAIGRLPTGDATDDNAVVIGYDAFEQLGSNPSLIGSTVRVDGAPHTIVGVMPKGFGFPERQSFWTVLAPDAGGEVVARLAPGANREAVASGAAQRLQALRDTVTSSARVLVQPWTRSRDNGGEGAVFAGLGVLVALLLTVCAANVATLLLVRANERAASLAIHSALGATRIGVAMQLLLEAALIAVGGGVAGLAGGFAMLHWMQSHLSQHWGYYWMRMEVRAPVVVATFGVVMLTAVVAGIVPAWRASRVDLTGALVGAGRGRYDVKQRRLGRWFVGAQVGLSTIALVAAAFIAWGATQLSSITALLPLDNVAVASIPLPHDRYRDDAARAELVARLQQELRRVPGVTVVSVSGGIPGAGTGSAALSVNGVSDASPSPVKWMAADANLFQAYEMKIVAGRKFGDADVASSKRVAIVTPSFVRRHLRGAAIGQQIHLEGVHGAGEWAEIVGVVNDWFIDGNDGNTDRVFVPLGQAFSDALYVSLGSSGDADGIVGGIRAAVARVDRELPVADQQTLRARMNWMMRMSRVIAGFCVLGGIGSALVAAIGLYGVMSFQVRSQIREIGVRMAIGAASNRIMRDIVRESIRRVAPGLLIGMAAAITAVPMLSRFMQPGDPPPAQILLCIVCACMTLIGIAAALEPALRAARLSPQVVLRQD